jgi:AcrR family transcriptional regulator
MTDQAQARKQSGSLSDAPKSAQVRRARGRPVGDRDAKRAELLQAALAVIAEEGYAAASLRKVAQRAGCTTGAVTYYFSSREEMMAAVLENRFDLFDELARGADGRGDIRSGFERWMDWANAEDPKERLAGFQLLAHARHEPALAVVYQRRYARYRDRLASVLAQGQERGAVRKDIPAQVLADQLCAMGDGWMMMLPVEPERFRSEWVKTLLDCTMALIAPPGDSPRAG